MVDSGWGRGGGDGGGAESAVVRYTGLVVAIDAYLEDLMSWDEAEAARNLGIPNHGDRDGGSTVSDNAGERLRSTPAASGGSGEEEQQRGRRAAEETLASPPPRQQHLPARSAKKTILVGVNSPNSVARAARGWDNDAPVVAPGMRHYPQRHCNMAALVGNDGFGGRAAGVTDGSKGHEVKKLRPNWPDIAGNKQHRYLLVVKNEHPTSYHIYRRCDCPQADAPRNVDIGVSVVAWQEVHSFAAAGLRCYHDRLMVLSEVSIGIAYRCPRQASSGFTWTAVDDQYCTF